jgi:hypothetical protein
MLSRLVTLILPRHPDDCHRGFAANSVVNRIEHSREQPTSNQRSSLIRHARARDFRLDAIRGLPELSANLECDCTQIDAIAQTHLNTARKVIRYFRAFETKPTHVIKAGKNQTVSEHRIVHILSDHRMWPTRDSVRLITAYRPASSSTPRREL